MFRNNFRDRFTWNRDEDDEEGALEMAEKLRPHFMSFGQMTANIALDAVIRLMREEVEQEYHRRKITYNDMNYIIDMLETIVYRVRLKSNHATIGDIGEPEFNAEDTN